jgi:hypothetical protein
MPQYSKTTWVNGSAPAISATNLNKIEDGIFASITQDGSTSMSGQFVTITGTAGTPSIAPTGDSDTGLFFSGANVFNFSAGGVSVITVSTASMVLLSTASTASGVYSQVNASETATATGTYSQINASTGSTASGLISQVNSSNFSIASGYASQVNASSSGRATGTVSQVNASSAATASAIYSQINASDVAIASGQFSQVNASTTSSATAARSQINASTASIASAQQSQVNASATSTASGTHSQINASFDSVASATYSQINASLSSTASGQRSQVNAANSCVASGTRSQINASDNSTASNNYTQINASTICAAEGDRNVIIASDRVKSTINYTIVGGFAESGAASTANRKWQIRSDNGAVSIASTLSSSVVFTDYAEMFPNFVTAQQGYGLLQTLEGEYVRPAQEDEDVIGVTSATAGIALGDSPFCWGGRYEVNEWGERIYIDVPNMDYQLQEDETEEDRPLIRVQKESENWNPELEQIPRSERLDEWSVVGLLGQVFVRLHEDTIAGDYVKAWQDGVGKTAASRTNIRVMKITQEYDAEKGYKIGKCFLRGG